MTTLLTYHYRPQILEGLTGHGIRPKTTTPPQLVHEQVSDLYRFELRRIRGRYMRGKIQKQDYSANVVELRKKYLLVSIPIRLWTQS